MTSSKVLSNRQSAIRPQSITAIPTRVTCRRETQSGKVTAKLSSEFGSSASICARNGSSSLGKIGA